MALSDRLSVVLEQLRNQPQSKSELAESLDCGPQGAKHRIHDLRDEGYSIEYDHSHKRYHLKGDSPYTPKDEIDTNEILDELDDGVTVQTLAEQFDTKEQIIQEILSDLKDTTDIRTLDTKEGTLYHRLDDTDKRFDLNQPDGEHTIAVISDTHLGSKAEHLEELNDFYDTCKERGVRHVFHCGDISDGWKVHQGHLNEIKNEAAGWGNLKQYVIDNYPNREGVTTHFIEGNHDNKFYNRHNIHFGKVIANERDDLHYCGNSQATFTFDREGEITLEMIHPSGGKPYTTGYRLQTLYRERNVDERPTIAVVGHLHGMMYADTEGVRGFYAGAWKGTTTYGKRKGHQAKIGGWILDLEIQDGFLKGLSMHEQRYPERATQNNYDVEEL